MYIISSDTFLFSFQFCVSDLTAITKETEMCWCLLTSPAQADPAGDIDGDTAGDTDGDIAGITNPTATNRDGITNPTATKRDGTNWDWAQSGTGHKLGPGAAGVQGSVLAGPRCCSPREGAGPFPPVLLRAQTPVPTPAPQSLFLPFSLTQICGFAAVPDAEELTKFVV